MASTGGEGGLTSLVCPKCTSSEIRRLSLVYKQGTAEIASSSTTVGAGVARGRLGAGVAGTSTTGMQQTLLAKELAPPAKLKWGWLLVVSVVGGLLILSGATGSAGVGVVVVGIILAAAGVWFARFGWRFNRDAYPHTVTGANLAWGDYSELATGQSVSHLFRTPGTFPYYCLLHPGMIGAVVVGDGRGSNPAVAVESPGIQGPAADKSAPVPASQSGGDGPVRAIAIATVASALSAAAAAAAAYKLGRRAKAGPRR